MSLRIAIARSLLISNDSSCMKYEEKSIADYGHSPALSRTLLLSAISAAFLSRLNADFEKPPDTSSMHTANSAFLFNACFKFLRGSAYLPFFSSAYLAVDCAGL